MRRLLFFSAIVLAAATAAPVSAARYAGELSCGDGAGAFVGARTVTIEKGAVAYAAKSTAKTQERWRGAVAPDGVVYVIGEYIWKTAKPLFLLGRVAGDQLALEGWRGPKRCRFEGARIAETQKED